MNLVPVLQLCAPSVAFRRSASKILARETSPGTAARIWEGTKSLQAELRSTRPRHSLGVNVLLRYFEWDCALFLAAKQEGLSGEAAGRLVEEINWGVFGPAIALSFSASRLRSKHLRTRVKWIVDLMFGVVFTSPFQRTTLPSTRDVAFDVTVCPLAEYFRDRGVPELTRYAACSLDDRMAEVWGVRLARTQTIAEGHSLCDFRFQIPARAALGGAAEGAGRGQRPVVGDHHSVHGNAVEGALDLDHVPLSGGSDPHEEGDQDQERAGHQAQETEADGKSLADRS